MGLPRQSAPGLGMPTKGPPLPQFLRTPQVLQRSSAAPPRPECFHSHRQWLEFLAISAEAQTTNVPGPLDLRKSAPAFNFGFDFCRDCTAKFSQEMQSVNKCKPGHLKDLSAHTSASQPANEAVG